MNAVQPAPSMACPSFFRAACRDAAQRRPDCDYSGAGYSLAGAIGQLGPIGMNDEEWGEITDQLMLAIFPDYNNPARTWPWTPSDDKAVRAWFKHWLPRCWALVPPNRRAKFLEGVYRHVLEDDGDFSA